MITESLLCKCGFKFMVHKHETYKHSKGYTVHICPNCSFGMVDSVELLGIFCEEPEKGEPKMNEKMTRAEIIEKLKKPFCPALPEFTEEMFKMFIELGKAGHIQTKSPVTGEWYRLFTDKETCRFTHSQKWYVEIYRLDPSYTEPQEPKRAETTTAVNCPCCGMLLTIKVGK